MTRHPAFNSRAACRDKDPDLFFPEPPGNYEPRNYEPARRICLNCPIQQPCLEWALDTEEKHGMYGALDPDQRKILLRAHKRRRAS